MQRFEYNLTTGGAVLLTVSDEEAAYFAALRQLAAEPDVRLNELIDRIYSDQNPALVAGVLPGRGMVTREVAARPLYQALTDLIEQKRVQEGLLDPVETAERYTVTVRDAATQLGISESAVHQAIRAGRLPSLKRGRRAYTTQGAVDAYEVGRTGPRSVKRVRREVAASEGDRAEGA